MAKASLLYRVLSRIKYTADALAEHRFLGEPLERTDRVRVDSSALPAKNSVCDLVCISFNNYELVPLQHKGVQRHVDGTVNYLVADNSSDENTRTRIRKYCAENGVSYVSLLRNPYKTGSQSHGAAINWMLRNYVEKRRPAYFGFIDHDIFPVKRFDIASILAKQPLYGLYQERQYLWYLWAGFCFFRSDAMRFGEMDFMPGTVEGIALDTGGQNWKPLYSRYARDELVFPPHSYERLRDGDVAQSDRVEIVGDWIHTFNGSYWMEVEKKERLLKSYLRKCWLDGNEVER